MSLELIQACMCGDMNARRQLIEQHYSSFMALARRYAKNNGQADTFFHSAFVHLFSRLNEIKSDTDLDSWMKDVFLGSIIQQLKNNKAEYYVTTTTRVDDRKKADTDLFHQSADEDMNDMEAEDYIRALQQLPSSFRAVYNMSVVDQYSLGRISQVLEVSEASAQNTLERARNQFAKNLQMQMHGYA